MRQRTNGRVREPAFDVEAFLGSAGVARRIARYRADYSIYRQGAAAETVMYVQSGTVKLSVVSTRGREAVVAMIGPGSFFGEGALAGIPKRLGNATALEPSVVLVIDAAEMARMLREQPALSARFIAHLVTRNVRVEADLVDQLFNSSEKRLARALLLLARYGTQDGPVRTVPKISQEVLAEMVGTTRSRVNHFMNKFRRLGFVEYDKEEIIVHGALLSVVLHP